MKSRLILLIGLCMVGFSVKAKESLEEHEYQDVKCFVQSSFGNKIAFFSWQVKELSKRTHQLAGKPIGKENGVENYVKKAIECVPMEQEFDNAHARKLDQNTLR